MTAPGIQQLAGRMGIGVDDGGGRAHTLQPDRLPHDQHLGVRCSRMRISTGGSTGNRAGWASGRGARRVDDDHVARLRPRQSRTGSKPEAATVRALPPTVTVTVSTDCWPLPAVMTSSPHRGLRPGSVRIAACCWKAQAGTVLGTVTVIDGVTPTQWSRFRRRS